WLERMGRQRYPNARELTVTADCGGSNGARVRLWKLELQKLADETGLVNASTTIRRAHRNGTRSSTGCSATSRRTGAAGRLPIAWHRERSRLVRERTAHINRIFAQGIRDINFKSQYKTLAVDKLMTGDLAAVNI